MQRTDGMNYAPKGKPRPVCQKGDFVFSAIALDHGHTAGCVTVSLKPGDF